jgi:hypothetical protein
VRQNQNKNPKERKTQPLHYLRHLRHPHSLLQCATLRRAPTQLAAKLSPINQHQNQKAKHRPQTTRIPIPTTHQSRNTATASAARTATWSAATTPSANASGSTWVVQIWKSCLAKRRAGSALCVDLEADYTVLEVEAVLEAVLVVEAREAEDGEGVID